MEGLMLKLKLQYFGHLMRRADSFEKTLMLGKLVSQLCLTLYDPMDCSPPGSSVHGMLKAKTLQWVSMPLSKVSTPPRDETQVSCIGRQILHH